MKKSLKISFFVFIFITFCLLIIIFPFWSPFYRDCNKIKIGMDHDDVYSIMSKYMDNKYHDYLDNSELEAFFNETENTFDFYQCQVFIKNDKVIEVKLIDNL